MNKIAAKITIAIVSALCTCATFASDTPEPSPAAESLFDTISALDTDVFAAFNNCSSSDELHKHAAYFSPDVEFYHDTGGVTWSRDDMIANTAKYVCGNFRRELVPGTLTVFPVKDFGAISQGVHQFCQFDTGSCDGMADFVMVWRNQGGTWQITRVLSYGHRPSKVPGG